MPQVIANLFYINNYGKGLVHLNESKKTEEGRYLMLGKVLTQQQIDQRVLFMAHKNRGQDYYRDSVSPPSNYAWKLGD